MSSAFSSNVLAQADTQSAAVYETVPSETKTVKEYLTEHFADAPIMVKIAQCESRFRQFDRDGNVLRGVHNDKDVGVMQINEFYHKDKAISMGIDLNSIEGNVAYARYLYEREGTTPWASSGKCWKSAGEVASGTSELALNK